MKPLRSIMIILCLLLLCSGQARAEHKGPYVGAYLGGNMVTDSKGTDDLGTFNLSYNPALYGSAVFGYDVGPDNPLGGEGRVELEYARHSNPLHQVEFVEGKAKGDGNLTVDSLLLNFIGVLHCDSRWSPYVGAGLGAARIDASGLKVSGTPFSTDTTTVFAYQLATGLDYAVNESLTFDMGYRFFNSIPPEFTESNGHKFRTDYVSHGIVVGVRWGF